MYMYECTYEYDWTTTGRRLDTSAAFCHEEEAEVLEKKIEKRRLPCVVFIQEYLLLCVYFIYPGIFTLRGRKPGII